MSEQTPEAVEPKTTRTSRKRASTAGTKRSATAGTKRATTKRATTKRATTKRATTKRASTARTRATTQTRKRTTSTKETEIVRDEFEERGADVDESDSTPARRAPTNPPTPSERPVVAFLRSLPISLYATVTLSLVLSFGGVAVGVSDAGAISVRQATEQYNQNIAERQERGEDVTEEIIPVQDSETRSSRPRFRPSVGGVNAELSEETAGSATSTAATATSTATSSEAGASEEEELLDSMREHDEADTDDSVNDAAAEGDAATSNTEDGADDGVDDTDVSGDE